MSGVVARWMLHAVPMVIAACFTAGPIIADETPAVTAVLSVSADQVNPGEVVELRLKLTVNAPWHVYGQMPGDGGQQPMTLRLKLPEGVQAVDGWVWSPMAAVLTAGEHVLTHRLRVTGLAAPAEAKVMLTWQACNDQICLPMELVELRVGLKPAAARSRDPR